MNKKHKPPLADFALCYSCGGEKSNPLEICESCKTIPTSEEQILVSLCSTTFMIGLADLENVRDGILKGITPKISSDSWKILIDALKEGGSDINGIVVEQSKYAQSLSKDKVPP